MLGGKLIWSACVLLTAELSMRYRKTTGFQGLLHAGWSNTSSKDILAVTATSLPSLVLVSTKYLFQMQKS